MNQNNGTEPKKKNFLTDAQTFVANTFLDTMREKIIIEKIPIAQIAETLKVRLNGVTPTEANIERCMRAIGMWKEYRRAVRTSVRRAGIRAHSTRLRDKRIAALLAAVNKIAIAYEIDISAELGNVFAPAESPPVNS